MDPLFREVAPRQQYLYVLKCLDFYKIGITLRPKYRIAGMSLPAKPEMVRLFPVANHRKLERELHDRFKSVRQHGEWFRLTDEHIAEIDRFIEAQS
jgi:hypothetical protein